jgi:N-acetylmuramic acid 6-phosphate etherase
VVALRASRRTPFAIAALRHARQVGAATILVAMNAGPEAGAAAAGSDVEVDVAVRPWSARVSCGSTRMKSGTAEKLILNMISTAAMVRLGKVYGNLMVDLKATSRKLAERAKRLVMMAVGVDYHGATQLLSRQAGGSRRPS